MKVLYMSHRYHTNQTTIMKGWIDNGHEVRFLSHYAGKIEDYTYVKPIVVGYSKLFTIFDNFYVNVLKRKEPVACNMKLKYGVPRIFRLAKYIKQFQPDVAIMRERSVYTICMYLLCRLYKVPAILYNQSPVWEKTRRKDFAHKIVWGLTPKYRITPVNLVGIDYTDLEKDNDAFWAPFVMEPQLEPEKKQYFANDRINIFCIGKYENRKNHQMMIEVAEELLSKYNIHLTIAGEKSNRFHDEYFRKINQYVKDHNLTDKITFLVNLNRDQVYEEYKKADVFVLPSTREPAAVSHLEAMAFAVPAISGSNNGTASYIDYGKTGYVFQDNDKEDLKDKLEKIICDKDNLVKMGAAAYTHVEENFCFQKYYESIKTIQRLLEDSK